MSLHTSRHSALSGSAQAGRSIPHACRLLARGSRKPEQAAAAPSHSNGATASVAEVSSSNGVEQALHVVERVPAEAPNPRLHIIRKSRWPKGIPAVMGAHLMPSGNVAPISTSRGAGLAETEHMFFYPDSDQQNYAVTQFVNSDLGGTGLANMVKEAAAQAIKAHGNFTLVLSGGSLLKALSKLVGMSGVDYSRWHVFYADERNVPHDSDDCTHKGAHEAFLSKVPIPEAQVHKLREGLPVGQAATEYAGQLLGLDPLVLPRNSAGFPVFDLILLGVGPDGHVASLFPNRTQTAAREGWVLPVADSPKPPAERITLTLPVLNAGRHVAIVAFGGGKAEIVQRALEVQSLPGALPAQLVRPIEGKLTWLLDIESAQQLRVGEWQSSKAFPRSNGQQAQEVSVGSA